MSEDLKAIRFFRPTPTDEYLANPHKGCCTFQRFNGDDLIPGLDWTKHEQGPLQFQEKETSRYEIQQGLKYHMTYFMPKSSRLPEAWMDKLIMFCQNMGYRFVFRQAVLPRNVKPNTMFSMDAWIENVGVAPLYKKYDFAVRLKQGQHEDIIVFDDIDVRTWLPGDICLDKQIQLNADDGVAASKAHSAKQREGRRPTSAKRSWSAPTCRRSIAFGGILLLSITHMFPEFHIGTPKLKSQSNVNRGRWTSFSPTWNSGLPCCIWLFLSSSRSITINGNAVSCFIRDSVGFFQVLSEMVNSIEEQQTVEVA